MNKLTKRLQLVPVFLLLNSLVYSAVARADTEFRGKYFFQTLLGAELRESGVDDGILLDDDLIRGNSDSEAVIAVSTNPINTNPFEFLNSDSTERLMVVMFEDGTVLEDVWGLYDSAIFSFGVSARYYLLNEADLAAAGKSVDEVVDIVAGETIELSLNWSDFGFAEFTLPDPDPAPTEDDIILGSAGNDRLIGTDSVDVFLSGAGSRDQMTGGEGGDFFVVGAEVDNRLRERDIILDFEPGRDVLVIDNGARMFSATSRNGNFIIQFQGSDRDSVVFRNSSISNSTQFEIIFLSGEFDISDIQPDTSSSAFVSASLPEPVMTQSGLYKLAGTKGNDRLLGSSEAEILAGLDGDDALIGGLAPDFFVFGASVSNGVAERDVIVDFNVDEDAIVLELGVTVTAVKKTPNGFSLTLSGSDGDTIFLFGQSRLGGSIDNLKFEYVSGSFLN